MEPSRKVQGDMLNWGNSPNECHLSPKEWDEIQRRGVTRQLTTGTEAQAEKNKTYWTREHARDVFKALRGRGRKEPAQESLQVLSQNTLPWVLRFRTSAQSAAQTGSCSSFRGRCELRGDSLNQWQQTEILQPLAEYPSDLRFCLLTSAMTSAETQSQFVIFAVWDAFS